MSPDNASYSATQAETQFAQGKAAMTISAGPSFFKRLGMPDDAWAAAPVPMTSANPPADQAVMSHVDTINVAIMKSSKHLDAAYRWLKFLTRPRRPDRAEQLVRDDPADARGSQQAQFTSNQNDKVWLDIQSNTRSRRPYQADAAQLEEAVSAGHRPAVADRGSKGGVSQNQVKSALEGVQAAAVAREAGTDRSPGQRHLRGCGPHEGLVRAVRHRLGTTSWQRATIRRPCRTKELAVQAPRPGVRFRHLRVSGPRRPQSEQALSDAQGHRARSGRRPHRRPSSTLHVLGADVPAQDHSVVGWARDRLRTPRLRPADHHRDLHQHHPRGVFDAEQLVSALRS